MQQIPLEIAFGILLLGGWSAGSSPKPDPKQIHDSAVIVDGHADTPQRFLDEGFDIATDTPVSEGHLDLGKARAGNLGAEFFSIWVDPKANTGRFAVRALQLIDSVLLQIARHPDQLILASSTQDILAARTGANKRLACLMGLEGGHAIENDLGVLRDFYRLGVRYMTLTWANTNDWADSSGDLRDPKVKHHDGLTDFGREVVQEMNRLGMIVDISHVSDKTFYDVLKITRAPVIASHSSARALASSPRNMTDEMLRSLATNGGVAMVNFRAAFIDESYRRAEQAQRASRTAAINSATAKLKLDPAARLRTRRRVEREWVSKIERPPFEALIDQIDHMVKVAGIDHVGLGSDFDGIPSMPKGMDSAADLPKITEALVARGYSGEEIHKILGGNFLRVFKNIEQASGEPKASR
jgi:membrane dipeptidase